MQFYKLIFQERFEGCLALFRYDVHLSNAAKFGVDKGFGTGVGMAIFQIVILADYGLSLW